MAQTAVPGNPSGENGLFGGDKILDITLSGNIRPLLDDRGDNPEYRSVLLSWTNDQNSLDSAVIMARTRGHFRKSKDNCVYPPILLDFSNSEVNPASIFYGQEKLKLVTPCQDDKYVVREYLVYKLYNLITDKSFRDRLVRINFKDTVKANSSGPMYGIILENEKKMAERNHSVSLERPMVLPQATDINAFLKMAVFEYMIGNTDWSVQYLQNVKLLYTDTTGVPVTVPYDFDHAGIVNAPYADPAQELKMVSVRQRRYRGYCIRDMTIYRDVFSDFNTLKPRFYQIYTDNPLLDQKYIKSTFSYLDQFFETINDPKKSEKAFTYPCQKGGTGNVVIKGLK